jgi:RNA polymerase sigma-70 factor, ECF subfamily
MATMNCLTTAWAAHEPELRGWLRHKITNPAEADDLLQDIFLKALRHGDRFCSVQNARAWLYEVARNTLADRLRVRRETVELPEELAAPVQELDTVDSLTACLPRVLSELTDQDREAITFCDLQGMPQAEFADLKNLSLSAAKSRLQRARLRLREHMSQACQVQLDDAGHVSDFVPRQ